MLKKLEKAFEWFLHSRSDLAMTIRTIVEAVVAYLLTLFTPDNIQAPIMGCFVVMLTVVLGVIRNSKEDEE